MEDYFSIYNRKRCPGSSASPPARVHSYPSYDPPHIRTTTDGPEQWTRYFSSYSSGHSQDMEQLCLRTGATARRRRGREEIVDKFSALTLDEDDQDQQDKENFNNFYDDSGQSYKLEPSRFQHNIFQSKILTSSNGSSLCFAQAQKSEVIRRVKMVEMGDATVEGHRIEVKKRPTRNYLSYLAVVLWILGIFALIFILKEQELSQGPLWSGSGMLTVTMSANVSEWDGLWRASFTVRSDNSLILYILLIGAVVGLIRQIFD